VSDHSPVDAALFYQGAMRRLTPVVEEHLFRIAQEAILNVLRHARARHLRLELLFQLRSLTLRVVDDGVGFDRQTVADGNGGFGLVTMGERARRAGGRLSIESTQGTGTKVEVLVPLGR
jgi:signal transduction histidine kinase